MRFTLAAATILGLASAAVAVDDRVLVKFSSPAKTFCSKWNTACKNYKPIDPTLVYRNSYCNLGDFSGKHADTEAKVYCAFVYRDAPDGPSKTVTRHVAKAVNATII